MLNQGHEKQLVVQKGRDASDLSHKLSLSDNQNQTKQSNGREKTKSKGIELAEKLQKKQRNKKMHIDFKDFNNFKQFLKVSTQGHFA